jgi:hypothetical protein
MLLLAAGTALLIAAGVVACQSEPMPNVGATSVASLAASRPADTAPSDVAVISGTLPRPSPAVAPSRLAIAAIGIDVTVNPVGLDAKTGDFDVPPSVDKVGWYRYGPGLETAGGSIVIAGHVDSADQGKGAFFRLRELTTGDNVMVTGADGKRHAFVVVAREEYAKSKISLAKYFARDGAVRLTLITCGGPFDAASRHYRDNIVVTAVPR